MKISFIVVALAGAVLPIFAPFNSRRVERRLFWTGFVISPAAIFGFTYPDWKSGSLLGLLAILLMLMNAYFSSSNLKFGGKIFAFNLSDSEPDSSLDRATRTDDDADRDPAPDSYSGMATAKKTWWLMPPVMVICIINIVAPNPDKPWLGPLMAFTGVAIAATFGYGDASWGYPVARGQRLQFVVASIITAGAFAVVYLACYRLGVRRPLRRKQSTEYRAHAHLRKKYPPKP